MRDLARRHPGKLVAAALLAMMGSGVAVLKTQATPEASIELVSPPQVAIAETMIADGSIAYRDEVALTSEVLGIVREVYVQPGQFVKKGDPLILLGAEQQQALLEQREASLGAEHAALDAQAATHDAARVRLARYVELGRAQLISQEMVEQAETQLRQAVASSREAQMRAAAQTAAVREMRETLRKTMVRAPISGTVVSVDIAAGETAVPSTLSFSGSTLLRIADTRHFVVTALVGEYDVWRVKPGMSASVVIPAIGDARLDGRVRTVATAPRSGNSAQGAPAYEITIDVDKSEDVPLFTGMSCRVEFQVAAEEAPSTTPLAAVPPRAAPENIAKVFVVRSGRADPGTVEPGRVAGSRNAVGERDQAVTFRNGPFHVRGEVVPSARAAQG